MRINDFLLVFNSLRIKNFRNRDCDQARITVMQVKSQNATRTPSKCLLYGQ